MEPNACERKVSVSGRGITLVPRELLWFDKESPGRRPVVTSFFNRLLGDRALLLAKYHGQHVEHDITPNTQPERRANSSFEVEARLSRLRCPHHLRGARSHCVCAGYLF